MTSSTRTKKRKPPASSGHTLDGPIPGLVHHCFGCSQENRTGLHLRFRESPDNGGVASEFRVPRRFEGPPGHVHGGIIATILDEAMGKVNRRKGIVALTRHMSIDYLRPVPLATRIRAVGWPVKEEGRKHFHSGEIRAMDGTVLARAHGVFIAVNSTELFEKYKERLNFSAANR